MATPCNARVPAPMDGPARPNSMSTCRVDQNVAMPRTRPKSFGCVNDQSIDDDPTAPFGGVGDSGYGRFGGRAGVEAFTDLRWITLQKRPKQFPF